MIEDGIGKENEMKTGTEIETGAKAINPPDQIVESCGQGLRLTSVGLHQRRVMGTLGVSALGHWEKGQVCAWQNHARRQRSYHANRPNATAGYFFQMMDRLCLRALARSPPRFRLKSLTKKHVLNA